MPQIEFTDVYFEYSGQEAGEGAVRGVTLSIEQGEFVAVIGHNGSGKSTVGRLINALLTPREGRVTVCGYDTADEDHVLDIRKQVGMVFQNPDNQLIASVVEEDVGFGLENIGVPPEEIRGRVDDALAGVGMSAFALKAPHMLSGGQKQRVAIAGVLAMQSDIILLDEPTAMLDPMGRREIMDTVLKLNEKGITVVWITHFMDEAALAGHVIMMDDGRVGLQGTPGEVFAQPERLTAAGLDAPLASSLAWGLRKRGADIGNALTDEELLEALCRLKSAT